MAENELLTYQDYILIKELLTQQDYIRKNELLTHQDYIRKNEIDGIENKSNSDIYEYPSLVALGESEEWYENIMGESENTLDLGGQHSPNVVAAKQLIGRSNHNRHRIDMLEKQGGFKNLWIDGAMQVWDGIEGEPYDFGVITALNQPRYPHLLTIMRHHTLVLNGVGTGVGGTYSWKRVVDEKKQWLKMTHVASTGSGYIGQRFDIDTLRYLKGKTVSVSFLYKATQGMSGKVTFYKEQNEIHDGISIDEIMGSKNITYVGDNKTHKIEVTLDLLDDNIDPVVNSFAGLNIEYGEDNGIPDGSIQFTDIQVEVNDKCTDFEFVPYSVSRERIDYFFRRSGNVFSSPYATGRQICQLSFGKRMRVLPSITYHHTPNNNLVTNYTTSGGIKLYFDTAVSTYMYVYNIASDARIY